jgi:peptide chain release factor 1
MIEKLVDQIESRFAELSAQMSDPAVIGDQRRYAEVGRAYRSLEAAHALAQEWRKATDDAAGARELLADGEDPELRELLNASEGRLAELEEEIRLAMVGPDPNDDKNVIVEIRAGTGGDEAALFGADLFRMYTRYAERNRWKVEILSATETDGGGFREIIFEVRGKGAYSHLRYESGVHRVQRVPATERQGRIHTSTASVAVLPEAEEVDIQIAENELKIDVYRSSGNGGQSVNTTDSAVRITHLPTGLVVTCQDEKSQLKNKTKALTVLRSRLYDAEQQKLAQERGDVRRSQIGSGERSEKIRTYNYPQDRISDHRVNLNLSNIPSVLDGQIDPFVHELRAADELDRLREAGLEEHASAAD